MNPVDRAQLVRTSDVLPQWGEQHGCDREAYHGPCTGITASADDDVPAPTRSADYDLTGPSSRR